MDQKWSGTGLVLPATQLNSNSFFNKVQVAMSIKELKLGSLKEVLKLLAKQQERKTDSRKV